MQAVCGSIWRNPYLAADAAMADANKVLRTMARMRAMAAGILGTTLRKIARQVQLSAKPMNNETCR